MNSSSFDRMLHQVLLVPILAVLLGATAIAWQLYQTDRTVNSFAQADERISENLTIEKLIIDEESGLRGFQTTHDPRFLQPYREGAARLPLEFERRRNIAIDNRGRDVVTRLEQAYDTWNGGFAQPLLAAAQAGGSTDDVALNLTGKRMMDDIRQRIDTLNSMNQRSREEYILAWRHQTRFILIALIVLAAVIGLLIGLYTRSLLQQVSHAFHESTQALSARAHETFQSEQRLRTTLESIGDGVITCNQQGLIQSMNQVACQLTGWSNADAHNLPLEQVFHIISESTRERVENPVEKVTRLNRIVALTNHTILIRADGSEIFIDDSGAPIRDQDGKLAGIVLVFRDVTLAKRSQEALVNNEKLAVAGRLAATIAHEIHNPLDSVSNLLFLMESEADPKENQRFLDLAKQEISRVTQITRAMLSLYRESRAPVAIDLRELLQSILTLNEVTFHSLGVAIQTSIPEGLTFRGFPGELGQALLNLLINAAEAAGPGGLVQCSAAPSPAATTHDGYRRPNGLRITVQDHGRGIPKDLLPTLFQPFVTTKAEPGTGLGLWVARGIVTRHGGIIELTSDTGTGTQTQGNNQTHGTTATVFLPLDPIVNAGGD